MSDNNNTIHLHLTTAQFRKLESQKPFQVTHQQLNGDRPADHHVEIQLEKKEVTKLNRNLRNGKGFRFNPTKIIGSGLFSTGLSLLKKAGSSKMAQNIAKQGLSKAVEYGKNSNNSLISGAANTLGNITGTGIFDTAMSLGKKIAKSKIAGDSAKQALNRGITMAANSNNSVISGAANAAKSISGGKLKLVKGSQEAKNRMAQIRAMRKTGSGFNFIKTLKKIGNSKELKAIGNIAKKTVLPVALQIAKSNPYTSPLAMGTEAILQSQGVSTGGKLTKRRITMPELIAQSYIRNPYPLEVKGGSFKSL